MRSKIPESYGKAVKKFTLIAIIALALLCSASAQYHFGNATLSNSKVKFTVVDGAASVSNYTDDTLEPSGWTLYPSFYYDNNSDGNFEDIEVVGNALSPSVHFNYSGQRHHFWPLHQSIMQSPGDAVVVSSGWIDADNYASKVQDASNLITIESTFSNFTNISGVNYFTQEINVTALSSALEDVNLIIYLGIDVNSFFNDYGFIDSSKNNMFKAYDTLTGVWFGAYPNVSADNFEVGVWDDGPSGSEDVWQHALDDSLNGTSSSSGDIEGALEFNLGSIGVGESKTITLYYSFGKSESSLYYGQIYCENCSDCNSKIASASDGSVILLNQNIINHVGDCIDNPANFNNKIFDCQGYTIDGDGSGLYSGIYFNTKANNTVRDCIITDFRYGIHIGSSNNNILINNNVNSNNLHGIYIYKSSNNNILTNNAANSNNLYGIYLSSSSNNILTNNTINNNQQHGLYVTSTSINNTINSNIFCLNNRSGGNYYDIYDSDSNSGDNNTCNTTYNWNDTDAERCTHSCPLQSTAKANITAYEITACGNYPIPQNSIYENAVATFNASNSNGTIVSYLWDFGDGNQTSGMIMNHSYPAACQNYTVNLTVTDNYALNDSISITVEVDIPGDINSDKTVNFWDLADFADSWGKSCSDQNYIPKADISGDGTVNFWDLADFAANWGRTC